MRIGLLLLLAACGSSGPCPTGTNTSSTVDAECGVCLQKETAVCVSPGHLCHDQETAYGTCAQAHDCGTESADKCTACATQFNAIADCVFGSCPDFIAACIDGK